MKLLKKIGTQLSRVKIRWLWIAVGLLLVGLHIAIMFQSRRAAVSGSGKTAVVLLEVIACGAYLIIVGIARTQYAQRFHLAGIIFIGVLLRLIMMLPIAPQSTDYYRYLWDGAVAAHGISPYLYGPASIQRPASDDNNSTLSALRQLSEKAGKNFSKINNPHLRTIYPPAVQGLFALAYRLTPFKIEGWRIILLIFDILTVVVLLFMLRSAQLPLRYLAVYLWNPLLLYETHHRGHLDLIVGVLILLFVWALMHRRGIFAGTALALAVGVKLWPLLLTPFLVIPSLQNRKKLVVGLSVFAGLTVLIMMPFVAALRHWPDSGVIAYAQTWEANTGIYCVLNWLAERFTERFASGIDDRIIARGMVVLILFIVSIWQAKHSGKGASQLCRRIGIVFVLILLLSPTIFPWYYIAVIPLAAISVRWTFLIWTFLLPMSHFPAEVINHNILMLLVHLPVWLLWLRECVWDKSLLLERQAINV